MKNFLKGIIIGLGGIAPGLSGSVLMVIFGVYQKTVNAISTIFNFKKLKQNIAFLLPLFLGMGIGVVFFSNTVNFLLSEFEIITRFAFLGLILGTLPLLYKEVKKEGIKLYHYIIILACAAFGTWLLYFNSGLFPTVSEPSLLQSFTLGISVAGSYIVPGVDSAAILNALGLYKIWLQITSLKIWDFGILIPTAIGLGLGVLGISFIINKLISKFYTITFSVIFGLFLSVIPSVIIEMEADFSFGFNNASVGAITAVILGFIASLYLSDIKGFNKKLRYLFNQRSAV